MTIEDELKMALKAKYPNSEIKQRNEFNDIIIFAERFHQSKKTMEITTIYTNNSLGKMKYYIHINTLLFSIVEISKHTYSLLKTDAIRAGWTITKCKGRNEKISLQ